VKASCAVCGRDFEAKTSRAIYCSGACKKRAFDLRRGGQNVVQMRPGVPAVQVDDSPRESIAASVLASFAPADLDSPLGRIALRLCQDVDALAPGSPGYASTVAQMRASVEELRRESKPKAANPLTLLRERRAADRATG
jgi:hypothetical protein